MIGCYKTMRYCYKYGITLRLLFKFKSVKNTSTLSMAFVLEKKCFLQVENPRAWNGRGGKSVTIKRHFTSLHHI